MISLLRLKISSCTSLMFTRFNTLSGLEYDASGKKQRPLKHTAFSGVLYVLGKLNTVTVPNDYILLDTPTTTSCSLNFAHIDQYASNGRVDHLSLHVSRINA
jgi:hypothetical protein